MPDDLLTAFLFFLRRAGFFLRATALLFLTFFAGRARALGFFFTTFLRFAGAFFFVVLRLAEAVFFFDADFRPRVDPDFLVGIAFCITEAPRRLILTGICGHRATGGRRGRVLS